MSDQRPEFASLTVEQTMARILREAVEAGASDVYLHANEDDMDVSLRQYGVPREYLSVPTEFGRRLLTHIKVNSGLDLTERRRPQDGRWFFEMPAEASEDEADDEAPSEAKFLDSDEEETEAGEFIERIDCRVSTIPTLNGEDCTIRLLRREHGVRSLAELGFSRFELNHVLPMVNSPGGLVLCTGPTGSGKTTTLYACLQHINNGQRKINTIEDPIEYTVEGLRQSQINPAINLDFPELLRGVLRQAPDVILIGEVRDELTAEVTVRAANSGHLVFSTLHSPVAAAAVQSMKSLRVHPHFLATGLLGVISQRLFRVLCPSCREAVDVSMAPHTFDEIRPRLSNGEGNTIYGPNGCEECNGTGYHGRRGVFEIMPVTHGIRQLISDGVPTSEIRKLALKEGMLEFRHSALLKVAHGETSLEEVFRVVPSEHLLLSD